MAFAESGGLYNFQASFNSAFLAGITASLPSWMTTAHVLFDYPESGVPTPSFAVTHFAPREDMVAGGYIVDGQNKISGVRQVAIADVSCWASRQSGTANNPNWKRDLLQMRDMVKFWANRHRAISALDIYSGTGTTKYLPNIIRLHHNIEEQGPITDDPNPAYVRHRMLLKYSWLETWQ